MTARTSPLAELRSTVGDAHAREATPEDAVCGKRPRWVAAPGTVGELATLLRLASRTGLAVAPRGAGTKLGWGAPPERLDLVLSTARLDRVLEHAAGDLVATVQAGVPLVVLREELARAGQRLALDPPPGGCVGGVIAADASGPLRLRFCTVRDLLIGITVVLADGTVAKAGGKVVKNVAGYDLAKLYTGSLGTLGVVAEATFRLHPIPETRRTVLARVPTPEAAGALVAELKRTALVPSAVELGWAPGGETGEVAVLFEGIEAGVRAQAEEATRLMGRHGPVEVRASEAEQRALWDEIRRLPWEGQDAVGLKLTFAPAALPALLRAVLDGGGVDAAVHIRGRAATGVLLAGIEDAGDAARLAARIGALRAVAAEHGGSVVLLDAPPELKHRIDAWGPVGDALPLMGRVKQRFDPERLLNPGRFVGGL